MTYTPTKWEYLDTITADRMNKLETGLQEVSEAEGTPGPQGKSAYQVAVDNGFVGTEEQWLDSLKGEPGRDGTDGEPGADGANGRPGADGAPGQDGAPGADGKSAYQIAVDHGFSGTEQQWLESLKGADGADGTDGSPGPAGADGLTTSISVNGTTYTQENGTITLPDYPDTTGGVTSFNGRSGAVTPGNNDYTAAMVHARPDTWVPAADEVDFSPLGTDLTSTDVQGAIEELFQSVSDGKTLVASAITDKGVATASDATFATMASNIQSIKTDNLPPDTYHVNLTASDPTMGTVSGGGVASKDMVVTVSAKESGARYIFTGWQEGNTVVTENRQLTFPVVGDKSLIANFYAPQYISGIDWHETNLPSSKTWRSISYGNGKFVAKSSSSSKSTCGIISSTDGVTWESQESTPSGYWAKMCYGDGKFLTIEFATGSVRHSSDGITWNSIATTNVKIGGIADSPITYGNGIFVAISNNSSGAKATYSSDGGKTWNLVTINSLANQYYKGIAFGNRKFVAVGSSGICLYSEDAKKWNYFTTTPAKTWNDITFGDGKFVAVGNYTDQAIYSYDGINWETATLPFSAIWYGVEYGDGKFVAVADGVDKAAYSIDGINWVETIMPSSLKLQALCFGNGRFVATESGGSGKAAYSYTGGNA